MNSHTMISVKMNKSLKAAAQKRAADWGLPLGTFINMLLRETLQRNQFTLTTPERPSTSLKKALRDAEKEIPKLAKTKGYTLEEMFEKLAG
jgi:antitoxin component of RelBE/YafQ-DinJ toxin-antitoxin module